MKEPTWTDNGATTTYHAGKFHYMIDGNTVLVTRDAGRSIVSVNIYSYPNENRAEAAAYRMARLQANA